MTNPTLPTPSIEALFGEPEDQAGLNPDIARLFGLDEDTGSVDAATGSRSDRAYTYKTDDQPRRGQWGDPMPLPDVEARAPIMPLELVPPAIRGWVKDEAELLSVNPEMVAGPAIVGAAALLGRRTGIQVKQHDTWYEVANLWGAIVAPPASRKTAAILAGLRFVREAQNQADADYEAASAGRRAAIEVARGKIEALKNQAKNNTPPKGLQTDLEKAYQELDELEVTPLRYVTNDTTVEKLGELLRDNEHGLLIERDELAGLLSTFEKPGREGDRAFYLEGWNGTNAYTVDRISRGRVHIKALTLSVMGGIQPNRLKPLVSGATHGTASDDGLVQRFQLLIYPNRRRSGPTIDRPRDAAAAERARRVYQYLQDITEDQLGHEVTIHNGVPTLKFTPAAQAVYTTWLDEHTHRIESPSYDAAPAFQAHLAKYAGLVAKLALIFHLMAATERASVGPVEEDAVRLAIKWAEFLELHARKLYNAELQADLHGGHALADRILDGSIQDGASLRDIYQRHYPHLGDAQAVRRAAALLEEHGWVRIETVPNLGTRPSHVLRVNPKLITALSEHA